MAMIILYGLFDPAVYSFPSCPFHSLTGWLCPGCGSQRAAYQVLNGHVISSIKLNPLFIPGVVYASAGYGIKILFPSSWWMIRDKFYGLKASYFALAIIFGFWILRNVM
jgi:hypothetical protein